MFRLFSIFKVYKLAKEWSESVDDEGGEDSYFHSMLRDGACKRCYPERNIKTKNFICQFHALREFFGK